MNFKVVRCLATSCVSVLAACVLTACATGPTATKTFTPATSSAANNQIVEVQAETAAPAFKAGRFKNLLLGLVILPFFVTFLIRTIAWKTILADGGWVVSALGSVGLLPHEGRLLSTSWAVIGGLTYNWIIFMILPLYVSLEKIDSRLLEASRDLYATNRRMFGKVILPLAMPGAAA